MRINRLTIDGYGVWTGLRVERFGEGLNVLYGPNEAGKTTLLAFIRGVFHGFASGQGRYLPPIRGGRPGGLVEIVGTQGQFTLERHVALGADGAHREALGLTASDGTRHGESLLRTILGNVDEAVFQNVFAVGLREMQELATLSDSKAAELLYSLTAGLDRVSLVEVVRELDVSRNRLLDRAGGPCQISQLVEQRTRLRREIEQLAAGTRHYVRLAAQREQLDQEVGVLEEQQRSVEQQARVIELATTLQDRWLRCKELDEQLASLAPAAIPEGAVDRLDAIRASLAKHEHRVAELAGRRRRFKSEVEALGIQRGLWRQAARIEALVEQQHWIESLEQNIGELESEVASLEGTLRRERETLGFSPDTPADAPLRLSHQTVRRLRTPAAAIRTARERVDEARQQLAEIQAEVETLDRETAAAFAGCKENELAGAIDQAGARVSQLRRRLLVDDRLDELTRYQADLEEQSRDHLQRQLLPVWVVMAFGGCFALGVILVVAGLFVPASVTGSFGWVMTVLGLLGASAAGFGKVLMERSNANQLEACQRQIVMLQAQIKQAEDERDALDAQLPQGGGPIATRLQTAERELALLEDLVPMRGRRDTARQRADAAARRLAEAEGDWTAARRRFSESLTEIGLPPKLSLKQVRRVVSRCEQHADLFRQLQRRREEMQLRRRELESIAVRVRELAGEAGIAAGGAAPVTLLKQLDNALSRQRDRVERYRALRREAKDVRRQYRKHVEAVSRLKHQRRALFLEAGVEEERQLRELADQMAKAAVLRKDRDAVTREIEAAAAGTCSVEVVGQEIEEGGLEGRLEELLERLDATENRLKEIFEQRGQIREQLNNLAADRQIARRQLDLASVEARLHAAVRQWQVFAVASRVLDGIRRDYERDRQPETLQEASGYLRRLTRGRYTRVWTPLGEDTLRIDDLEGNARSVESLSRGTREQLFLALRLALAAWYARRGVALPLVLDDVLVNFDADRAQAAAELLRDFAQAGHQLLVFTCHEHVFELFRSLDVPAAQLPSNAKPDPAAVCLLEAEKPKRRRTGKSKLPAPAEPPVPPPAPEPELEPEDDFDSGVDVDSFVFETGADDFAEEAEADLNGKDDLEEDDAEEDDSDEDSDDEPAESEDDVYAEEEDEADDLDDEDAIEEDVDVEEEQDLDEDIAEDADAEVSPLGSGFDEHLWDDDREKAARRTSDRVFDADFFSSEDELSESAPWEPVDEGDGFGWFREDSQGEHGADGSDDDADDDSAQAA